MTPKTNSPRPKNLEERLGSHHVTVLTAIVMFNAKTEILPRWDIISGVFCDCNGHIFENWVIDVFDTTEESDWFWRNESTK
jgi:hypothetical protein